MPSSFYTALSIYTVPRTPMQHESAFTRTKKTHARERETVIWRQFQTIVDGTVESSESHMHLRIE